MPVSRVAKIKSSVISEQTVIFRPLTDEHRAAIFVAEEKGDVEIVINAAD